MARSHIKLPGFEPVPFPFTRNGGPALPASSKKRILMREEACDRKGEK